MKFQKIQVDNLVDFEECCQTRIYLQNFVLIQPKTSENLPKFCQKLTTTWSGSKVCQKWRSARRWQERTSARAPCSQRYIRKNFGRKRGRKRSPNSENSAAHRRPTIAFAKLPTPIAKLYVILRTPVLRSNREMNPYHDVKHHKSKKVKWSKQQNIT